MKDIEKVQEFKFSYKIKKILCDKCGKEGFIDNNGMIFPYMHNIEFSVGYGSDYDGDTIQFDLCDECLTEFMKSFKHKPDIKNWMF